MVPIDTTYFSYNYIIMKLKINSKAPNFKLPSTDGSAFELNKIKKKHNFILLSKR